MNKLKVMSIFGTRPDAVKMAPLVIEMEKHESIDSVVCVTGQHRKMLDQVLEVFKIHPSYDLNIMLESQSLFQISIHVLKGLEGILEKVKPDVVLVQGDTATAFIGGLAAFYDKISVGHVEAGLRSGDKYSPFPEEINRRLATCIADHHFAPTSSNKANLLAEGVNADSIFVTGNTGIDAFKTTIRDRYVFSIPELNHIDFNGKRVITVTAHRRENLGEPLRQICQAILHIAQKYPDVEIVYPVHLNPAVQSVAREILGGHERIHLTDPADVLDMHNLLRRSYMVMTDSGGLQEEVPAMGKPVLVLRRETERPEAVEAGTVKLAGVRKDNIIRLAEELLENKAEYERMAKAVNPYGDGNASKRVVDALLFSHGFSSERPKDFQSR